MLFGVCLLTQLPNAGITAIQCIPVTQHPPNPDQSMAGDTRKRWQHGGAHTQQEKVGRSAVPSLTSTAAPADSTSLLKERQWEEFGSSSLSIYFQFIFASS